MLVPQCGGFGFFEIMVTELNNSTLADIAAPELAEQAQQLRTEIS
jgi:hypothetical protein